MTPHHILVVLTSHDTLGHTGRKTGFWLEEFATPYYVFRDAGAAVTLASPAGGQPPIDPKSAAPEWQTDATRRFDADDAGRDALAHTLRLSDVDAGDYDAIFFPGGHGPMWDFPDNAALAGLIEAFDAEDKPIGAVCHGPVALVGARKADGTPLVAGRRVTGFTNGEEDAVGLRAVVPFLLEDRLRALGATVDNAADFSAHAITDGTLVTGQNPQSSEVGARAVLALLVAGRLAKGEGIV
ncbi:type 1 glutamine amidotransferase domain-containing protein [Sulfitobacter sp. S190]|uniref:type 1 glutamine amidotransferase domain-containing protein n=1 Tax=Sulfitobacter sp. S190 TaxID=2867022 RepID=UPI0021A76B49|nr:type 1 glutamine amidotransferase domain-containing protein [Sulfitobacter sp. S190]UWR23443.1 type 1 glutamine amidotransferase domain-containing protein [Sulfitobacter sp. S190]